MKRAEVVLLGVALLGVVLLSGCAAKSNARSPQAAPSYEPSPAAGTFASPPPPPPPAPTTPGTTSSEKKKRREGLDADKADQPSDDAGGMAAAMAELDLWARSVELSLSSCEMACRALGSLERAARHVCELADDRSRCDDATRTLREARARVKAACGQCAGGPTTEPDAPLR